MSQPSAVAAALIEADETERQRLLREADAEQLAAVIVELGHRREPRAAAVLELIDLTVSDRGLRKAARRELHRLRSVGVQVPQLSIEVSNESRGAQALANEPRVSVSQAWATDFDPSGSRALWLLGERTLGGAWLAALLLNDQAGLHDLSLVETTRKRFQRELEQRQRDQATWVGVPGPYALQLVREAVDLTRAHGTGLPTRYRAFREAFGEAPAGPERALVYETISPVEVNFNPEWLEETRQLIREPEVGGWHIGVPDSMRARALEVARAPTSALVVPTHPPEQLALELLAEAAQVALTAQFKRALRRRLEETAFIFVATDRLASARLAVAAARALDDAMLPLERQPFLRGLLEAGLARLIQGESVGGRRASDALVELMEHASERRHESGSVETRPSGLILPR